MIGLLTIFAISWCTLEASHFEEGDVAPFADSFADTDGPLQGTVDQPSSYPLAMAAHPREAVHLEDATRDSRETVSFAATLAWRAQKVRDRVHQAIDDWVNETMNALLVECERLADLGCFECRFYTSSKDHEFFWPKDWRGDSLEARRSITRLFEEKLSTRGFSNSQVSQVDVDANGNQAFWSFAVSWQDAMAKDKHKRPLSPFRGMSVECPICLEVAPGVALYPCGHAVCHACFPHVTRRSCPCCRQHVTGATKGLFMTRAAADAPSMLSTLPFRDDSIEWALPGMFALGAIVPATIGFAQLRSLGKHMRKSTEPLMQH
eukprot:gnl/TRDRNA2_/TRDRNA2_126469_c0_seq1.p1 gnl/TRDRNA2_/TRDRNA2_126469_c0~~gnl/TRDRNA2_/TRDRNA2_126469_c0_seq1.p1  ORF type:complete len:320 (+),score=33.15 gnl/TRDRNA2_/TRDRNA2_126469_c0_seq1:59-1018(+)